MRWCADTSSPSYKALDTARMLRAMLPGSIGGRQLAVEALSRRPSLKVLYTSGYSKSAMLVNGFLDAGVLLLAKPYRRADLAKMIRTALAM
jgi:hypothetical protein